MNQLIDEELLNFIVAEQKAKATQIKSDTLEAILQLNARTIFKNNNPNNPIGILDKEKIIPIFSRGKHFLAAIKQFFDALSQQQKFVTTPFAQVSKKGEEYYWIKQYGKFGMTEYKLPYFEGLHEIINSYLFGIYRFDIDFKEFYEEAMR